MNKPAGNWLPLLREWIGRQQNDNRTAERLSLGVDELLEAVPDYEICEAYHNASALADDQLAAVLAAECERRNLEY